MIEFEGLPAMTQPVMLAAFEGWNDAAEAATGLIDHVLAQFPGERFAEVDPEDYYDFQVNRPIISVGERGLRELSWPATAAFASSVPDGPDLVIVRGIEPSMRWRSFISE